VSLSARNLNADVNWKFNFSLVFRWLFIPWLQTEVNAYVDRVNNTRKRADRNKVLPHGPPNDIFASPERYGCLDFKASIKCLN
jgi:hypothetical protein